MLRTLVICLSLFVTSFVPLASAATVPADSITAFHAVLLDNMRNGSKLACVGRTRQVTPAVDANFDLAFLTQRVLRRQWVALSPEQRKQFGDTFRELVISTYAAQFSKFGGETFATLDTQELPDGTRLVHSKLTPGSGAPVTLDYVLHDTAGEWRIINVIAEGVSDLALRSTQYDKAYKAGGFDGLLALLQNQIKGNKDNCS